MGFRIKSGSWKSIEQVKVRKRNEIDGSPSWETVQSMFVKAGGIWKKFFSSSAKPVQDTEIIVSTNSSGLYTLQAKIYQWLPSSTTLKYRFKVINKDTGQVGFSPNGWVTFSNPSAGSYTTKPTTAEVVLPASPVLINSGDGLFWTGAENQFGVDVEGTYGSVASVFTTADTTSIWRSPKAPTVEISNEKSTSFDVTITANSLDDWYATQRYILYLEDTTSGEFVYPGGNVTGIGGFAATAQVLVRAVSGTIVGHKYKAYVIPTTGTAGSTPYNYTGYPGDEGISDASKPPTELTWTVFPSISPNGGYAGETEFTCDHGTATGADGSVIQYTYQWQYMSTTFSYVDVASTSSKYTPPSNFNSLTPTPISLTCRVTAYDPSTEESKSERAPSVNINDALAPEILTNPVASPDTAKAGIDSFSTTNGTYCPLV